MAKKKAKKNKSPFVAFTPEEVFAAEAISFIIIAGYGIFYSDNDWIFDKKTAIRFYTKIAKEASIQLLKGSKKEKKAARHVLNNLRIEPLRIH